MTAAKAITNEDLLETMQTLMQMTSDGFERLDKRMDRLEERMERIEARMDAFELRMDKLETRVGEIERRLAEHDLQFAEIKQVLRSMEDKHAAYINDIEDILDRLQVLEDRMPNLTPEELTQLRQQLHELSDWARHVAKLTHVPLHPRP